MKKIAALSIAISTLISMAITSADAQNYPARPLRMVVGAATGGTPDILARIIGPKLYEQLGQPVIVDNRPGATGNIGADVVAKATADGGAGSARFARGCDPVAGCKRRR